MGVLGDEIQRLRAERGFTVRAFAEKLGKSPGYVSKVETRDEIPSPELICDMSEHLKVKPERLLELAKEDQLKKTEAQIDKKSTDALNLYRRSR